MSTLLAHDFAIAPRDTGAVETRNVAGDEPGGISRRAHPPPEHGTPATIADPRADTTVVLVAPELLGTIPDPEQVWTTVRSTRGAARVLVRVLFPADFELAASLSWAGLAVEVLVNPGIEPPGDLALDPAVNVVRMPPGSRPQEVDEFALVLSDVVMTDPRSPKDIGLLGMADRQRKPLVAPGEELPALSVVSPDIAGRLNTEMPHWRYCFCHVFGRLEQFFQEAFAFNWRGKARHGFKYSCGRLKLSFLPSWAKDHGPYFAPEDVTGDWRKRVPDRAAADGSALIVKRFNAMDHTALHGSFLHRDLIWFVHFASAWAVLFAVAGALHFWPYHSPKTHGWPATEVITLLVVGVVILWVRRVQLLEHWTSCRLAAEQLRIARLCLPLLVVPWALRGGDKAPPGAFSFTVSALNLVKRSVRDQGLPRLPPDYSVAMALAWLDLIVKSQRNYHTDNHLRLDRAERDLHWGTTIFYGLAIFGASAHFFSDWEQLLVLTAAGPAFAAALHGVVTRLGIVHRIELSREIEVELAQIHDSLVTFDMTQSPDQAWRALRDFALRASDAMGNENTSWHSLVRREKDEV
jgi:hypothetical protein